MEPGDMGETNQVIWVYLIVSASISFTWILGLMEFSYMWVFLLIVGLYGLWRSMVLRIVRRHLSKEEQKIHRKRALKQSETLEWLNFIFNRWWVFSSHNLEDFIKKRIDERLETIKPSYLESLVLKSFTFGDHTPSIKYISAFEYAEGVPGGRKPATWVTVNNPPENLDYMSSYRLVLEADVDLLLDQFQMIYTARVGRSRVGLSFDIAVEEMNVKGTMQIILQLSMDVAFPHVVKATVSFTEMPDIWFNMKILKNIDLSLIPFLKTWLYSNITQGIGNALVDPGKIDIPLAKAGPIQAIRASEKQQPLAQGVLTIHVKGISKSSEKKKDDLEQVKYVVLKVGDEKRTSEDFSSSQEWEDVSSFFVYNMTKEKLIVKNKLRLLLNNKTLDRHEIYLSSLPLEQEKNVKTKVTNKDGSVLELNLQYTTLTFIDLGVDVQDPPPLETREVAGVIYLCVHSAVNVIAADKGGTSDPYCVVFSDRRRIMTTPYIPKTRNPKWERHVEFFVKDYTKVNLAFYVFDWDGINTIDDDFLGFAHFTLKESEAGVVRKTLTLGYNHKTEGYKTDDAFGQIIVSVLFRPISSVSKSERYRTISSTTQPNQDYLYTEDLVSPATKSVHNAGRKSFSSSSNSPVDSSSGNGYLNQPQIRTCETLPEIDKDKALVELTILQARDLIGMDRNGLSDPFCELIYEDKKIFKTSVKKNTLFPKWNECVNFEVVNDASCLEINVYDKDMFSRDFLGKLKITFDKMKELSHKGSSEWLKLSRTKSGEIQIKCNVTCNETVEKDKLMMNKNKDENDSKIFGSQSTPRQISAEDEVFVKDSSRKQVNNTPEVENSIAKEVSNDLLTTPPLKTDSNEPQYTSTPMEKPTTHLPVREAAFRRPRRESDSHPGNRRARRSLGGSTEQLQGSNTLPQRLEVEQKSNPVKRSASDVNVSARQNRQNGYNSDRNDSSLKVNTTGDSLSIGSSIAGIEKLYSVSGKILQLRGLNLPDLSTVYCKIRTDNPRHRRLIPGKRVIAKSEMVKASNPVFNTSFEVDRGAGVSVDTEIIIDIKRDQKEHIATQSYPLCELFSDYEEGGKHKWLTLSNGIAIEVFLHQGQPNPRKIRNKNFNKSWSFRHPKSTDI